MKALRVNELLPNLAGVALEELATPRPQAGEVLVKIRAATLGFPDFLMTHGGYQLKPPVPFSPGMEGPGKSPHWAPMLRAGRSAIKWCAAGSAHLPIIW